MRDMTVRTILLIPILQPFLQLSVFAYLHRRKLGTKGIKAICEGCIDGEFTGSLGCVAQEVKDELVVHRNTRKDGTILFLTSLLVYITGYTWVILR